MRLSSVREQFFSNSPPARIIGTEMEYTVPTTLYSTYKARLEKTGQIFHPSGYLGNGAKIYQDVGHLEYASPESLGPLDAAATDHAGQEVISQLHSLATGKEDPPLRRSGTYDFVEHEINTKGYHENYLFPTPEPGVEHNRYKLVVGSYLATRAIWYGAGFNTSQGSYLTQKSSGIGEGVVDGFGHRVDHGRKPLAGVLEAGDKVGKGFSILEVRHADPHMLPYATFLGLAATSLVLRLLEHGAINSDNYRAFCVVDAVESAKTTNDIGGFAEDVLHELQTGERVTSIEIQKRFAHAALALCSKRELPADEKLATHEWVTTIDKIEAAQVNPNMAKHVLGYVEWISKNYLGRRKGFINGYDAARFDVQWSSLYDRSTSQLLVSKLRPNPTNAIVEKAKRYIYHPPATRAAIRGRLLTQTTYQGVSWNNLIRVVDGQSKTTKLENPYQSKLKKSA